MNYDFSQERHRMPWRPKLARQYQESDSGFRDDE